MFSKTKKKEQAPTSTTQSHLVVQQTSHNLTVQRTHRSASFSYSSTDAASRSSSLLSLRNMDTNRLSVANFDGDKSKSSSYGNVVNTKTDAKVSALPFNYRNSPVYRSFQAPQADHCLQKSQKKYTVKKTGEFYDNKDGVIPTYKTSSKNRGQVLIVNNINFEDKRLYREGAKVDDKNLKRLFKNMGFSVVVERDLKAAAMESKIESFSQLSSLKSADISILVVMSHGTAHRNEKFGITEILGTDDNRVLIEDILENFSIEKCKNMTNKPKIFIFQCCRGEREQVIHRDSGNRTSQRSDMLIAYSTIPGFASYRNPVNGSWYVQLICEVFSEHAHERDIEDMLKIVEYKLSGMGKRENIRQTSSYDNRGFKKCYLHPK